MDLFDAIARRHSYRGEFAPQPVPRGDLSKIVQAGIQAPSAKNEQVVSFLAIDDPALLAEVTRLIDRPVCATARAMIVCATDNRPILDHHSFAVEDCAAAVENMLLAITALGYASVWLDGVLRYEQRAERLARLLNLPADRQVRIVLPLGVPVERVEQKPRLPFDARARFNRWTD